MSPELFQKPNPEVDRFALDRRLVSGVAWTAAAKWGSQVITSGALLIQARLLSPADFGILGMTYILLGFVNLVAEFGLGSAIVVMRELSPDQIRQTHVLAVFLGIVASGATALAAAP
jgi:PST family polysaccharide transporter